MKSKKKKIIAIVATVTVLSMLFTTVTVAALSNGGISNLWDKAENKDGIVKYEKPSVGDIAQDGAYPDEVKSDASANAKEKEWYEYITYSKKPIGEVKDGNRKMIFYDPYDYNYGMIMKLADPQNDFGDYYNGEEGYTTANEISVSYSKSQSYSWGNDTSFGWGFEEEMEAGVWLAEAKMKFTQSIGISSNESWSNDSNASKNVTYNALYFNSNGAPYRWRIVKYTVYLPLYCEEQTLIKDEWVVTKADYCVLATVQGTCREWIENGVAFIEDWRSGEPIQVEKFWNEFFTKDRLEAAYKDRLLPEN